MTLGLDLVTRVLRLKKPVSAPAAPTSGVALYVDPATGKLSFARTGTRALLENPVTDVSSYPAQPATLIDAGTSATNWGQSNADAPTYDSTFNAIKSSLRPANNNSSTPGVSRTYVKVNGGTPLPIGTFIRVVFDFQYSSLPGGVTYDLPQFAEAFVCSANDGTSGTVVRVPLPVAVIPDEWVNGFEVVIFGTALSQVGSVGLRHKGSPTPGKTTDKVVTYMRNVRFDEATEIDVAAIKATGSIVVPADFTPTGTQWYRAIPASVRFEDFRPGHERLTRERGYRSLRDHFIPEDMSRDVTQDVNRAISDPSPLRAPRGAVYLTNNLVRWHNVSCDHDLSDAIFTRNAFNEAAPYRGLEVGGCNDFSIKLPDWRGYHPLKVAGAGMTSVATERVVAQDSDFEDQSFAAKTSATGSNQLFSWVGDSNTNVNGDTGTNAYARVPGGSSMKLTPKAAGDISAALPIVYRVEPSSSQTARASFLPSGGASSSLAADITGTPSTFSVTSAPASWPSGATQFTLQVDNEIIFVTRSGNTLTVATSPPGRGYNGSTIADHSAGTSVQIIFIRSCEIDMKWYKSDGVTPATHANDNTVVGNEISARKWLHGTATAVAPNSGDLGAFGFLVVVPRIKGCVDVANEGHDVDWVGFQRTAARAVGATQVGTVSGGSRSNYLGSYVLTAPASPALAAGYAITVAGSNNSFDGNYTVDSVTDSQHFNAYLDTSTASAPANTPTVKTDALLTQPGDEMALQPIVCGRDYLGYLQYDACLSGNGLGTASVELRCIDWVSGQVFAYQVDTVLAGDSRVTKTLRFKPPDAKRVYVFSVRRIDGTGGTLKLHHATYYQPALYANRWEQAHGLTIPDDNPSTNGTIYVKNVEGCSGNGGQVHSGKNFYVRGVDGPQAPFLAVGQQGFELDIAEDPKINILVVGCGRSGLDMEVGQREALIRPDIDAEIWFAHLYSIANNGWDRTWSPHWGVVKSYYPGSGPWTGGGINGKVDRFESYGLEVSNPGSQVDMEIIGYHVDVVSALAPHGFRFVDGTVSKNHTLIEGDPNSGDTSDGFTSGHCTARAVSVDPDTYVGGYIVQVNSGLPTSRFIDGPTETVLAPSITGTVQDWTPAGLEIAREIVVQATGAWTLGGLGGGWPGRRITLINPSGFSGTLSDENASSTNVNRFALNGDRTMSADSAVELVYAAWGSDAAAPRWRVLGQGGYDVVDPYRGGLEGVNAIGNSGTAKTLSLVTGNVQTVTNSANCTYTMPSGLTSGKAISFTLIVTNNGAFTATFTGVKWAGGTPPVLSSGVGKVDVFTFVTTNGGTTWYGFVSAQALA